MPPNATNAGDVPIYVLREEQTEFLVGLRFPHFKARVAPRIKAAMTQFKGQNDTSDSVVDFVSAGKTMNSASMWADDAEREGALAFLKEKFGSLGREQRRRERWRKFIDDALSYEYGLRDLSDEEFLIALNVKKEKIRNRARMASDERSRKSDLYAFFSQPTATADFAYWLPMPAWSIDEAVALSFGKDPRVVSTHALVRIHRSLFRPAYEARTEQVRRAVTIGQLTDPIRPAEFSAWAKDVGIDVDKAVSDFCYSKTDRLRDELADMTAEAERLRKSFTELTKLQPAEPGHKRLVSLYRILLGLAVLRYGHFKNGKAGASRKIAELLAPYPELKVGEDAIRDCLQKAKEFLDFDPTQFERPND
ncbi:hypothetical protein [Mesorhizobium sp. Cs1321R2N1]|uniref:hypothetical protein n=1 Tax=Mesorhizobium sp. Cs1321R2N1 TaxID=3015174 RepID=UPI00301B8FF0